jgi:hypothetical protein
VIYAYWYLALGIATLLFILRDKVLYPSKIRSFFRDQLTKAKNNFSKQDFVDDVLIPLLTGTFVLVFWPIAVIMCVYWLITGQITLSSQIDADEEKPFSVSKQHLIQKLSLEEIEGSEIINDPLGGVPNVPFGHLNKQWCQFKENHSADTELWSFNQKWKPRWGAEDIRSGYAALQNGQVLGFFVKAIEPIAGDEIAD